VPSAAARQAPRRGSGVERDRAGLGHCPRAGRDAEVARRPGSVAATRRRLLLSRLRDPRQERPEDPLSHLRREAGPSTTRTRSPAKRAVRAGPGGEFCRRPGDDTTRNPRITFATIAPTASVRARRTPSTPPGQARRRRTGPPAVQELPTSPPPLSCPGRSAGSGPLMSATPGRARRHHSWNVSLATGGASRVAVQPPRAGRPHEPALSHEARCPRRARRAVRRSRPGWPRSVPRAGT